MRMCLKKRKGSIMNKRQELVQLGSYLFSRGYALGSAGNLSVRLDEKHILIIPTKESLGVLKPDELSLFSLDGKHIEGKIPTKELEFHLMLYQAQNNGRAIIHLHSTYLTALSCLKNLNPTNVIKVFTPYNLTTLFNEVPFLHIFSHSNVFLFKYVEYLFPYEYAPEVLARQLQQNLFNLYPGQWNEGERGLAALSDRVDEFKQSCQRALVYSKALKCKNIHAMAGVVKKGNDQEFYEKTFVDNLRDVADFFASWDITVLIEPLNGRDFPNYFLNHPKQAIRLIEKIDRPNVKLQFDLYHIADCARRFNTLFI